MPSPRSCEPTATWAALALGNPGWEEQCRRSSTFWRLLWRHACAPCCRPASCVPLGCCSCFRLRMIDRARWCTSTWRPSSPSGCQRGQHRNLDRGAERSSLQADRGRHATAQGPAIASYDARCKRVWIARLNSAASSSQCSLDRITARAGAAGTTGQGRSAWNRTALAGLREPGSSGAHRSGTPVACPARREHRRRWVPVPRCQILG